MIRNKGKIQYIKQNLLDQLKEENAFWSYSSESVNLETIKDNQLIALTLRHLDLSEIRQLFLIFSQKAIKKAWIELLVPEGDYLYTLNRFFAWYYFKAKKPDSYLKSLQTRHFNRIRGAGAGLRR